MFKYSAWVLGAACFASAAQAQPNVQLSGGAIVGFKHTAGKESGVSSRNALETLGPANTGFTLRVQENLGSGHSVSLLLNHRLNLMDGAIARGQPFWANARLGWKTPWGELAVGRFGAAVEDLLRPRLDVYMPMGFGTSVYGGPLDASSRYNGMLSYTSPRHGAWQWSATWVPRSSMTSQQTNTQEYAILYDAKPWVAGIGFTRNAGASASAADNVRGKNVWTLGIAHDAKWVRWGATLSQVRGRAQLPDSQRWSLAARVPLSTGFTLKLGWERFRVAEAGESTRSWAAGLEYALSRRTTLFTELATTRSNVASKDDTGLSNNIGIRHRF